MRHVSLTELDAVRGASSMGTAASTADRRSISTHLRIFLLLLSGSLRFPLLRVGYIYTKAS